MSKVIELYFMAKLASFLTKDWKDMDVYKLGIIDATGKPLKKSWQLKTIKEKVAYSVFTRFALNLRRIIESFPGGKSRLVKYLAAYALFKEETEIDLAFESYTGGEINTNFQQFLEEEFDDEIL